MSSHRRKSAAGHKFDMVWLYRSPRLSQWGGEYFTRSNDFYLPSLRLQGGRSAPSGFDRSLISVDPGKNSAARLSLLLVVRLQVWNFN